MRGGLIIRTTKLLGGSLLSEGGANSNQIIRGVSPNY